MFHQRFFTGRQRSRFGALVAAGVALTTTGATLPITKPIAVQPMQLADITIQVPVVIPGYPVIIVPRDRRDREVTVRFIAQGDDWASIYLDGRLLFRANNTRRDHTVTLERGAYYLEITGVTRFEQWDAGYLDVGRNDTNIIVVRYGPTSGIRVAGDPYTWLPD
ncbi:MAG: hypothetical protein AAGD09_22235 [Cyanobacteria bacterium P01_F01_bin.56]